MTQQAVADAAGISAAFLSQLESGAATNPTLDTLKRLADALGVRVTDLLDGV